METKDFMRGLMRYCGARKGCKGCLLMGKCLSRTLYQAILCIGDPGFDEMIEKIEDWIKQNPEKTRQDVFLERYPGTEMYPDDDVIIVSPCYVDASLRNKRRALMCDEGCRKCGKNYWSQPADDDNKNRGSRNEK